MIYRPTKKFTLGNLLRSFWPLFLLSSFLPVLFFGVQSSTPLSLFSRADNPNSMRVWIEPSKIIATSGQTVTFTLMAELDKPQSLLPSLSAEIASDMPVSITSSPIMYQKPFGGRIVAGTFTVLPGGSGMYTISIPKETIQTGGISVDSIETGGASLIVK